MKCHYYVLTIGLSVFIVTTVTTVVPAKTEKEKSTVDVSAEKSKTKTDEEIPPDKMSSQMEYLNKDFSEFKSEKDAEIDELKLVVDKKLKDVTERHTKLEIMYRKLLERVIELETIIRESDEELFKKGSEKASIMEDPAVKSYLEDYYVDYYVDVEKEIDKKKDDEADEKAKKLIKEIEEEALQYDANEVVKYVDRTIDKKRDSKYKSDSEKSAMQAQKELHKAQKLFYSKRYNAALKRVNKSLSYKETALGYALEGSILLTIGDKGSAIEAWESALDLDPDMEEVREALDRYSK